LQKLLYYMQGLSLAFHDRPLFGEWIEAWSNGPVVPEIYHAYKRYGWASIFPREEDEPDDLSDEERDHVDSTWLVLKRYSATSLREMTHRESPWVEARSGYQPKDRCSNEITHESMSAYFGFLMKAAREPNPPTTRTVRIDQLGRIFYFDEAEQLHIPGLEPSRVLRGMNECKLDMGRPFEDVLAEPDEAESDR
ncbi:MAG: type II toxin-antitoxin system antitoxin SocA domain-containing protein, partial [Singulisphaera sp.]